MRSTPRAPVLSAILLVMTLNPADARRQEHRSARGPLGVMAQASQGVLGQIGGASRALAVVGDLAYLGVGPRLVILDLADPSGPGGHAASPRLLGQSPVLPGIVEGVAVDEDTAYVAVSGAGLWVLDVADSFDVRPVGSLAVGDRPRDVAVAGDAAYVITGRMVSADGSEGRGTLHAIDVSDPSRPVERSALALEGWPSRIVVQGDTAYIQDGEEIADWDSSRSANVYRPGNEAIWIVDVADPSPRLVATLRRPDGIHAFTVQGSRLYVASASDRSSFDGPPPEDGFFVYDMGDPRAPRLLGSDVAAWVGCSQMAALGDAVVVSCDDDLYGYDVARPERPVRSRLRGFGLGASALGWHRGALVAARERHGGLAVIGIDRAGPFGELGSFAPVPHVWNLAAAGSSVVVHAGGIPDTLHHIDVSRPEDLIDLGGSDVDAQVISLEMDGRRVYAGMRDDGVAVLEATSGGGGLRHLEHRPYDGVVSGVAASKGMLALAGHRYLGPASDAGGIPFQRGRYTASFDILGMDGPILSPIGMVRPDLCEPPETQDPARYRVALDGNLAYLTDEGCGLHVIDLTDPAHPVQIGTTAPHWIDLYSPPVIQAGFAYAADYEGLAVFDVREPRAPVLAGTAHWKSSMRIDPGRIVAVGGERAFVADWDGIRVLDITRPEAPLDLGWLRTAGRPAALVLDGGALYVADGAGGLLLLDPAAMPESPGSPSPTVTARPPKPTATRIRSGFTVFLPRLLHSAVSP